MKRTRLPLVTASKLALCGLWRHPWRLLITVVLTVSALVLFGLAVTAALFREDVARIDSIVAYERAFKVENEEGSITQEQMDLLRAKTGIPFSYLAEVSYLENPAPFFPDFPTGVIFPDLPACVSDLTDCGTSCYMTEEALEANGYTLIGRLPQTQGEIAINSCLANAFLEYGYYDSFNYPRLFDETLHDYRMDERGIHRVSSAQELVDLGVSLSVTNWERDLYEGNTRPAKIVGVVDYGNCYAREIGARRPGGYYDAVFVCESFLRYPIDHDDCVAVTGRVSSAEAVSALLELCGPDKELKLSSTIGVRFQEVVGRFRTMRTAFIWAGVALGVFAALLVYQFAVLSVAEKKDMIGVLRALGAHVSDVYKIFLSEGLFLVLVSACCAIPITFGLCVAVNSVLWSIRLPVAFMHFGVVAPLLEVLVGACVNLVATVFPARRLAQKEPIDCIRLVE